MSAERPYSSRPSPQGAGGVRCPDCGGEARADVAGAPILLEHAHGCAIADGLEAVEPIALRQLGSNRVHLAVVPAGALLDGSMLGAPCELVVAPVIALCRRTLRGALVRISAELVADNRRNGRLCRECELVGEQAVERPDLLVRPSRV